MRLFEAAFIVWACGLVGSACSSDASQGTQRDAASGNADASNASNAMDAGAASETDTTEDAGVCMVTAPTKCPTPKPHYADVAPIFQARCISCHSGATADSQWPLTEYEHVADWYDIIQAQLLACTMPPADAGVPMTNDERLAILNWIRCGFPK